MKKAKYIDGFVLIVPKKSLPAYKRMATKASKIWKKYGALDYKECVIDDPKPKGVVLTFGKLTKVKPTESIVFAYISYESKAHRNKVNAQVMKDPSMNTDQWVNMPMPMDMKKMAYAGFKVIVDPF